ncbi:hypothetical protein JCM17823_19360 [Halorubrum gandharaense]
MYHRIFDDDWETLTRREAIDRAFALGVAAAIDDPQPEELERVVEGLPSGYDRSLVELAYDEGRTKALASTRENDDAIWRELVDDVGAPQAPPIPAAMPGALRELTLVSKSDEGPPSALELPPFLRK